jgi:ketosteroid isomerase-like protein
MDMDDKAQWDALERRMRMLEDKEEIRQAIYSYAHGTDRCQRDQIRAAYHDDAVDDHGSFSGGPDEVADIIAANSSGALNSQHHVGNVLIELDGDTANVESYFIACQLREVDGATYTRFRAGRYLDRFERRAGQWRIARRMVVEDWARLDRVSELPSEIGPNCVWGSRGSDDLSFRLSDFTGAVSGSVPG